MTIGVETCIGWSFESLAEGALSEGLTLATGSEKLKPEAYQRGQVYELSVDWEALQDEVALELMPNPAKDRFVIELSGLAAARGLVSVLDMHGRVVFERVVSGDRMDVKADWPAGVYTIVWRSGAEHKVRLLVKED